MTSATDRVGRHHTSPQGARKPAWNALDAELVDTLQADRARRRLPLHVRTAETRHEWPRPVSRIQPKLSCPYCGRRRCVEHKDLPKLDPYFNGEA